MVAKDTEANEDTKTYPSMTFDHKVMPGLKKHKIGDTGHMRIKYKVTGQQSYRNGESHTNMDITHGDLEPAKRVKGKSDKDLNDEAQKDQDNQPQKSQP